jgi:hypothetical protein
MMLRPLTRSVRFDAERRCSAKSLGIALVAGLCLISGIETSTATTNINKEIELYKIYTHIKVSNHKEYSCINTLWSKESNWNPLSKNKKSSAKGIPQLLKLKVHDPFVQIDLGLKYIAHKHRTPCKALAFHNERGWY